MRRFLALAPTLALSLHAAGCVAVGGAIDPRPPDEVPCASTGYYRPDECRVFELGPDRFQLLVEDDENHRHQAIEFAHQQLPKLCPGGFDVISNGVSFKDDNEFFIGDHQDAVISTVIRCVRAPLPPEAQSAPLPAGASRAPVVPVVGAPKPAPAPPPARRWTVELPGSAAPGPASP